MLSQAKGLSVVDGDQFIYAVAIDEAAIEYGDFRVFKRQKAAIEIYDHERVSGLMEIMGSTCASMQPRRCAGCII
jgi:hypothetical protein